MRTFSKSVKKTHEKSPEVATGSVLWKKLLLKISHYSRFVWSPFNKVVDL